MNWFTQGVAILSAVMVAASAIFFFFFASEFFLKRPYYEWLVIAGGLLAVGVSFIFIPMSGMYGELGPIIAAIGSLSAAFGFFQAYRRSSGGI